MAVGATLNTLDKIADLACGSLIHLGTRQEGSNQEFPHERQVKYKPPFTLIVCPVM